MEIGVIGLNVAIVAFALGVGGYLAFSKRLSASTTWRAMLAPLASIMGSGFLVSAPLLGGLVGYWAVICMSILLLLAFGLGEVMRFNIRFFEPVENETGSVQNVSFLARVVLAGAYFISITYYLQLLAVFFLHSIGVDQPAMASWLTSGLLTVIAAVGMWRGLGLLERVEKYAVALNLGMIGSLLVALAYYNLKQGMAGDWQLPETSLDFNYQTVCVLLGLLIVVQGFETSRYLGDAHPAEERVRTMRYAQIVSSCIYIIFLALATLLFEPDMGSDVTAIIEMARPVAYVLPVLLTVAAIGSQFSAGVADTEGAGGLIVSITHHRVPMRYAYLLILLVTLALTWETNVNQIIAYASRAFALYYALQCMIAVILVSRGEPRDSKRLILFAALTVVSLLVFFIGAPAE